jgi:transcriptional regulator with XRE-family HTH domain
MRRELTAARKKRGWSQAELGRRAGLPQAHVSGIETGKIAPRVDTFLDLVRVLGLDLVLVPRELVPAVTTLVREARSSSERGEGDLSLYAERDHGV